MTDKHLRSPVGVLAVALATFLVVLALLTARVSSGHDPALAGSTASVVQVSRGGHSTLRTTASGRVLSGPPGATGAEGVTPAEGPLVTRSSPAAGAGEHDD
jgi:hypothetical protein